MAIIYSRDSFFQHVEQMTPQNCVENTHLQFYFSSALSGVEMALHNVGSTFGPAELGPA